MGYRHQVSLVLALAVLAGRLAGPGGAAVAAGAGTAGPAEVAAPLLRQVLPEPLPDPYVFRYGGEWSIWGTGTSFYHGPDLRPDAMTREELQFSYADPATRPAGIWGFVPYRYRDGSWHGYATLHYGSFRTVVAHFLPEAGATWQAGKPITRWRFDRVLAGDVAAGRTTFYESKMVADRDGTLYLLYSASPGPHQNVHIWAQRMLDPGRTDPAWQPRALLSPEGYRSEDRNPGYIQIVEGANLSRIGSKWVLLYSAGDFKLDNYKLGVAYSDRLIPPPGQTYRKVLIPDPQNAWGNTGKTDEVCYLLQSERAEWPNFCRQWVSGPGLGNIVRVDGGYRLVFHGYRPDDQAHDPEARRVWVLPLRTRIREATPMRDWLQVVLPGALPSGAP